MFSSLIGAAFILALAFSVAGLRWWLIPAVALPAGALFAYIEFGGHSGYVQFGLVVVSVWAVLILREMFKLPQTHRVHRELKESAKNDPAAWVPEHPTATFLKEVRSATVVLLVIAAFVGYVAWKVDHYET